MKIKRRPNLIRVKSAGRELIIYRTDITIIGLVTVDGRLRITDPINAWRCFRKGTLDLSPQFTYPPAYRFRKGGR